jgi:uncharacterized protein (TIGR02217 family)
MGGRKVTTGFINTRLSLQVASGFVGGPEWSTSVVALASGREVRNKLWAYPRQKYTANVGAFSEAQRKELLALFYTCAGQWGAFRFSDRVDCTAVGEGLAVVSGTKTPVQLVKNYTFGTTVFSRPIYAPISDGLTVFTGTTNIAGTVDEQTGLFTPANNWPSTPVQWSGRFDVWVRFSSDYSAFTATRPDLLTADIDLLEVRA